MARPKNPIVLPGEPQIALDLATLINDKKNPIKSFEVLQVVIEKALANQRCETYKEFIAIIRNHEGTAFSLETMIHLLSGMIVTEKTLYRLEE